MATSSAPQALAQSSSIIVVGAGVIGLSIAHDLRLKGHKVHIVARDMPQDTASTLFASPWAGANCVSYARDEELVQHTWERATWRRLREISKERPEMVKLIPFELELAGNIPWWADMVEDLKDGEPISPGATSRIVTFNSWVLDVPSYLEYLYECLTSSSTSLPPVQFIRTETLTSLASARKLVPGANLVINASALGSRWLTDVADESVVPARGQTLLVRSNVQKCFIDPAGLAAESPSVDPPTQAELAGSAPHFVSFEEPDQKTLPLRCAHSQPRYIIPRAGSGTCILGGTFEVGWDKEPVVSEATSARILRDCVALCPELEGCEIISANVGLRPVRLGGVRLEAETLSDGDTPFDVVHCYGAGPAGYQQSWGQAEHVVGIVEELLNEKRTPAEVANDESPYSPRL